MTDTITDAADTFAFASLVDDAPISFRKWLLPCGIRPRASVQITHGVAAVSPGTHRCPGADRRCCVQLHRQRVGVVVRDNGAGRAGQDHGGVRQVRRMEPTCRIVGLIRRRSPASTVPRR
jgi:hypothetical protein